MTHTHFFHPSRLDEWLTMINCLVAPATLPSTAGSLSVLSYNVLLPNSIDAWWTFKMYNPPLMDEQKHVATWKHRQTLLRDKIQVLNADVVCLQEVAPDSFQDDFAFMEDLGYDGSVLFRKGRFRPATFWKTTKCELAGDPVHKDRTLLTAFRTVVNDGADEGSDTGVKKTDNSRYWYVLNCHLQAGSEGKRRVRQIQEGTKAIVTLAKRLKDPDPTSSVKAVVCGDFNGGQECGAIRFLEHGFVDETFIEDGEPVSSSKKALPFKEPMIDVVANGGKREAPPTMVVAELISQMVKGGGAYEDPDLSPAVTERLERIYASLATFQQEDGTVVMDVNDVEKWLVAINQKLGRGDEMREAARQMGWQAPDGAKELKHDELKKLISLPRDGVLSLSGFVQVYQKELDRGKFWGIAHDLAVLGEPLPSVGLFRARYDRMYCTPSVSTLAIADTLCDRVCPNDTEPSDHLPVAATLI